MNVNGSQSTSFAGGNSAAGAYWGLVHGARGGMAMALAVAAFSGPLAFIIDRDLADAFDVFVAAAAVLSVVLGLVGSVLGLILGFVLGALGWERSARWVAPATAVAFALGFAAALDGESNWWELLIWAVYIFIVATTAHRTGASFERRMTALKQVQ